MLAIPSLAWMAIGSRAATESIKENVVWKLATGKAITAAPVFADGLVFCGNTQGNFYAVDPVSGTVVWKYDAPFPISARAAVSGQSVCIESGNQLIAIDKKTGVERWRFVAKPYRPIYSLDLTDYHRSSPVIADDVVYYGDDWGNLNGVGLATGKLVFQYTTDTARPIRSTPVVDRGVVYFGDWEGDVHAVSVRDGRLLWKHRPANTRPYYGAIVSEFRIHDGILYFGSQHDVFEALDAGDGHPVWSYTDANHTYLPTTPLVSRNRVFIGTTIFTHSLLCLDQGRVAWSYKAEGIFFTAPLEHESLLIANSSNFGGTGHLYLLDIDSGRLISRTAIELATPSTPVIAGDLLIIGAGDGCLYGLSFEKLAHPPLAKPAG